MRLTDRAIINIKPSDKLEKYYDGAGLHLAVLPSGVKSWRYSYRFRSKQKLLTIGEYPVISLKKAREKLADAKRLLADGIDPAEHKQSMKRMDTEAVENSFEMVAKEWHLKYRDTWTPKHGDDIWGRLYKNVLVHMGSESIGTIKPWDLLKVLRRIEARGALEQAHRVMQICGNVFRYAVATGRAERDITSDLRGAIPPKRVKHHASLTEPKQVGQLLRVIQEYKGNLVVACALQLSPLVFCGLASCGVPSGARLISTARSGAFPLNA
ncbi:MAG: integrase arm-type DNA-binding domain-containing protein [Planctomycetaceae bacterium]|nr:integrase arm-type DNA-binding domain-containing protein [Planctomycetaceae bacterium]